LAEADRSAAEQPAADALLPAAESVIKCGMKCGEARLLERKTAEKGAR
jgi:hypothetical protein